MQHVPVEELTTEELIIELEDKAEVQVLWNRTAQLFAEAAKRLKDTQ